MSDLTLLGMCGSLRRESTNRKLMNEAARRFAPATFVEGDLRLPLLDQDIEAEHGIPAEVQRLADQIAGADAVVVVTPEYNKGISGVLKNALDWVSRTKTDPWRDKPVAIMSAAAGRAGGERAQNMLRLCLTPFRPHLLPGPEVMIARTAQQWDESGTLTDDFAGKLLGDLMQQLRQVALTRHGENERMPGAKAGMRA